MAKNDRIYFENLIAAAEYSCQAADYLVVCMNNFGSEDVKTMLRNMHQIEHAGDGKKHEMEAMLAKAFVTPVDREDLALISHNIDDVTDSIEEVLQGFYMYRIEKITPEAITFAAKIAECCKLMKEMLGEFINFNKPAKLHSLVIDLNHMEEECDKLYIESTMSLQDRCDNMLDIISWREIYNRMEQCADACEHIGDNVDMVVMKNS
jgi:predicted phosphate transport protein (TIGR00153 family)